MVPGNSTLCESEPRLAPMKAFRGIQRRLPALAQRRGSGDRGGRHVGLLLRRGSFAVYTQAARRRAVHRPERPARLGGRTRKGRQRAHRAQATATCVALHDARRTAQASTKDQGLSNFISTSEY